MYLKKNPVESAAVPMYFYIVNVGSISTRQSALSIGTCGCAFYMQQTNAREEGGLNLEKKRAL